MGVQNVAERSEGRLIFNKYAIQTDLLGLLVLVMANAFTRFH